jgi:tryptophan synthase alpha chain
MNRLKQLFQNKNKGILSLYFTAGFPQLNDTCTIIKEIEKSGADLIEIGIPFSDPLADGPTIQRSGQKSLDNGMTVNLLFQQLQNIRKEVNIPLILMGYLNPVIQYGFERFCKKCKEVGIDGLILPDLPVQEYIDEYQKIIEDNGLILNFLISPQTPEPRVRQIATLSEGFIYLVSSYGTTGAKTGIEQYQKDYFSRIAQMNLPNAKLIGFGISDHKTFSEACQYANGAIIGSAFIKMLENSRNLSKDISSFIHSIKDCNVEKTNS